MKLPVIRAVVLVFLISMSMQSLHAQGRLMRRLQERTEQKIEKELFGEDEKSDRSHRSDPSSDTYDADSRRGQNRRGAGLSHDIPDVMQNITDAGNYYGASEYIQAKRAVRNALWGVELEIGQKVLESLPKSVEGMGYVESQDNVSSTGVGFMGLIIERMYEGAEDMQLRTTIGSDAALLGLAGLYMVEGAWVHSTDQPDRKQIRFKDHQAVIHYNDYDGYTLSLAFGQSSVFIINGINFENENHFMSAANHFDIQTIKKELGEAL